MNAFLRRLVAAPPRLPLLRTHFPVASWRSAADSENGGNSCCQIEAVSEDGEEFLRFSGRISFDDEVCRRTQLKAGFCTMVCARPDRLFGSSAADLTQYSGLEVSLRSSKARRFVLNLEIASMLEGDMFQIALDVPENKWVDCHLPFSIFT